MAFSKDFPRPEKSPNWERISLTTEEEKEVEKVARKENIELMKQCIEDAKEIVKNSKLKVYQSDVIRIAIALFEKIASHQVYWKERACKEKFEDKFKTLIKKP